MNSSPPATVMNCCCCLTPRNQYTGLILWVEKNGVSTTLETGNKKNQKTPISFYYLSDTLMAHAFYGVSLAIFGLHPHPFCVISKYCVSHTHTHTHFEAGVPLVPRGVVDGLVRY